MALSNKAVIYVMKALKSITADPTQPFTAYDVTKAARNLTDERIDHHEVRDLIHAFYDKQFMPSYDRFAHTFPAANGQLVTAQLFCPSGVDPNGYDPDKIQFTADDQDGGDDQPWTGSQVDSIRNTIANSPPPQITMNAVINTNDQAVPVPATINVGSDLSDSDGSDRDLDETLEDPDEHIKVPQPKQTGFFRAVARFFGARS